MSGNDPTPDDRPDPEETAPFATPPTTPYPSYDQPPPQPQPPSYGPPQPGYPAYGGQGYAPQQPAYYAGVNHQNASTSMWLGITGIAGVVLTPVCCVTLPLLVCSPIAWVLGAKARNAIDATAPGTYANRGQAQAGFVMGIIGSVLGILAILGLVAFGALLFSGVSTSP